MTGEASVSTGLGLPRVPALETRCTSVRFVNISSEVVGNVGVVVVSEVGVAVISVTSSDRAAFPILLVATICIVVMASSSTMAVVWTEVVAVVGVVLLGEVPRSGSTSNLSNAASRTELVTCSSVRLSTGRPAVVKLEGVEVRMTSSVATVLSTVLSGVLSILWPDSRSSERPLLRETRNFDGLSSMVE